MKQDAVNIAFEEKVRRGIFAPVARHLTNLATAEDRLQDAICQTWLMYRRYAEEKSKILPDAILVHSCRQRAVDPGRNFVPAEGGCKNQDVLDPRAYRGGNVHVLRLQGVCEDQCADGNRELQSFCAEHMAIDPSRKIRSAIDLKQWIGELSHLDRYIMEQKYLGASTAQIAHDLGMPYRVVYQKTKEKGLELAKRAGVRITSGRNRREHDRGSREIDVAMKQVEAQAAYGEQ